MGGCICWIDYPSLWDIFSNNLGSNESTPVHGDGKLLVTLTKERDLQTINFLNDHFGPLGG